ncbi:MAG TPA: BACON domain-containing carbohydrate-binding protein [Blastocatellia bacterium]|nr:BACON domain-containing carbohydrate-binding protein [Blastocatellia bacterium]HMZ19897.1 BACON domain-containing carbohydrate-binding protein [Blastocatellia bacterium]HNG31947.1 BACON domain-containing carbohydrate-binding protein [Blastocatellia bacterium]
MTNTGATVTVRMFFINGARGTVKSETFCLAPNQSASLLASRFDPGVSGYAVAVAVDSATGCPISHNFLIGDAYVKLATRHFGRLKAVAAAANFSGVLATCSSGATTAAINFDDSSTGYNRVARTVTLSNIPSRGDGNSTLLVLNRIGGNLATGAATIGAVSGTLFNDATVGRDFNATLPNAQLKTELSNSAFPPSPATFDSFITAGRTGWLKLWPQNDVGILGTTLNFNPNPSAGAFNTAFNLRHLTLATNASYTMPVSVPNCGPPPEELAVDDGSFEEAIGVAAGVSFYYVNRLTPTKYPATLSAVAIYFRSDAGVRVGDQLTVVSGGNSGGGESITGVALQQTSAQVQELGNFNVYNVPPLTITSGDFVVGMKITTTANVFPAALDKTPPLKRRSYVSLDGNLYVLIDDVNANFAGNFGIRARLGTASTQCNYDIAPTNQDFSAAAGTGSVSVTAGSGCSWTASSNAPWLTITSGASGSGNGAVNFSVAANTTGALRTGTLTVAGKTFTVNQGVPSLAPTIANLSPATVLAGGGNFTLTVTGTNFVNGSSVRLGGSLRSTTFVGATQLTATILASDLIVLGTREITVVNPAPGGGTSNAVNLTVAGMANVSAASFSNAALAPESIVALFGVNLATGTAGASSVPLPTVLLGTRVRVTDSNSVERDAQLFFVAPTQINYLVPAGSSDGVATVSVSVNGNVVGTGRMTIARTAPGLLSANASGQGVALGLSIRALANGQQRIELLAVQDALQRYVPLPIDLGVVGDEVFLSFYGTGFRGNSGLGNVKLTVGGVSVPVLYASVAPGFVGLDQLNAGPLPRSLAGRGLVDVVLTVDGKVANTLQVSIK